MFRSEPKDAPGPEGPPHRTDNSLGKSVDGQKSGQHHPRPDEEEPAANPTGASRMHHVQYGFQGTWVRKAVISSYYLQPIES